jgi:hypothetical protein
MMTSPTIPWKDLDTKGFVHVPAFLTPEQLEACRANYANKPRSSNANYNTPGADNLSPDLNQALDALVASVAANTTTRVDGVVGALFFATKRGVNFGWHQDHESYFELQSHANYLNLYIPIVKPRPDKTNLCLIPFDALERKSPELFRRCVFQGATSVYPFGDGQFLVHDDTGVGHALRFKFDDIASIPHLHAGDVLIVRGDVLHKTQDSDTDRVALSVRFAYSKTMISRRKLADGGLYKSRMLVRNMHHFQTMFHAFDLAGRQELSWGEMKPLMDEARTRFAPVDSPKLFLLKQKIRSGVLVSSIRKAAHELWNPLKANYHARRQKRQIKLEALSAQPGRVRS